MLYDKDDRRIKFNKNKHIVESMVSLWETAGESNPIDVLGSYRGTPYDADDLVPEQDADDL
ncbi:MAG: hypothetical protein UHK54_01665 [Acutalibacteraceae bacterium]|nr:hypothetical protein [Clostridia bacterium]MEE1283547.1 hypothetical protein [Acutalibacteraceae bacterium]